MHKTTAGEKARELEGRADCLKAEAEALKGAARLEDLHVWQMQKIKTTKKGSRYYGYWMASWREGNKTRNVHLGSSRKMESFWHYRHRMATKDCIYEHADI